MAPDPQQPVTDHEFDPGDHAYIEHDHRCHDCGRPLDEHDHVPVWVLDILLPRP